MECGGKAAAFQRGSKAAAPFQSGGHAAALHSASRQRISTRMSVASSDSMRCCIAAIMRIA